MLVSSLGFAVDVVVSFQDRSMLVSSHRRFGVGSLCGGFPEPIPVPESALHRRYSEILNLSSKQLSRAQMTCWIKD